MLSLMQCTCTVDREFLSLINFRWYPTATKITFFNIEHQPITLHFWCVDATKIKQRENFNSPNLQFDYTMTHGQLYLLSAITRYYNSLICTTAKTSLCW